MKARPIVEQLVDLILSDQPTAEVYEAYLEAQRESGSRNPYSSSDEAGIESEAPALVSFLALWTALEAGLIKLAEVRGVALHSRSRVVTPRELSRLQLLEKTYMDQYIRVRQVRNQLLHGPKVPNSEILMASTEILESILRHLSEQNDDVRNVIDNTRSQFSRLLSDRKGAKHRIQQGSANHRHLL